MLPGSSSDSAFGERRGERVRGRADTTKARELGWEPQHNLAQYIADFTAAVAQRDPTQP